MGWIGKTNQPVKLNEAAIKGDKINHLELALVGIIISLKKSFIPSIKNWRRPQIPIILGPFLLWTKAITFLSKSEYAATGIKIKMIVSKLSIKIGRLENTKNKIFLKKKNTN